MKRFSAILVSLAAFALCGADWLQFRGENGNSLAKGEAPPLDWDDTNIKWKVEFDGRGVSSPIVVKNRIIVTSNLGVKQKRILVQAFGEGKGELLWRREFWATGRTSSHPTSANAAPTPASDGERIYAFYSSNDLICLDLDGNLVWYRGMAFDYPKAGNDVGMASSPLVVGDTLVVQIENQGDSFAAGLDKRTGETKWRLDRPEMANWASPIAMPSKDGKSHVVLLQSASGLTAVNAETGAKLWSYDQPCSTVASAATAPGLVFVPSNGTTVLSVPDGATSPEVVWDSNKVAPGSASAVLDDTRIFALNRAGVLTCASREDGEVYWQQRVGGTFWGTPILAGGYLFAVNQEGKAFVVDVRGTREKKKRVVFSKDLGAAVLASPAVAGTALYIRGESTLWKIAN